MPHPKLLPAKQREQYTVGWICPLQVERTAAIQMLDERHEPPSGHDPADQNIYDCGCIGKHNVVIAGLRGTTGLSAATSVVVQMCRSFKHLRFGLLVGIGSGVPSQQDVHLGDVVISIPDGTSGGVIQWDKGKLKADGTLQRTGSLNQPPSSLLGAALRLGTAIELEEDSIAEYITDGVRPEYRFPEENEDCLYDPEYKHQVQEGSCSQCDCSRILFRKKRGPTPKIYQGIIASGNREIKNGAERDRIAKELGNVLCFETEAAGLMNDFPCLVVRGRYCFPRISLTGKALVDVCIARHLRLLGLP